MSWIITGQEAGPADPYYNNVSLLLHGDGANGSTTIVDNSPSPRTVTAFGDAQISTAQSKFGGASLAFDGSGDYLSISNSASMAFGSDAFTVEAWIYQTTNVSTYAPIFYSNGSNGSGIGFLVDSSRGLSVYWNNFRISSTTTKYALNVWNHLACVRDLNGSLRAYLNGTPVGSGSAIGSPVFGATWIGVNQSYTAEAFNGYIDDLRITKGIARYTANFTPPTAPFPDF